jgi:hypothetical protein
MTQEVLLHSVPSESSYPPRSATTRMAIGQNRPSIAMLVFPNVMPIACVSLAPVSSAHESPGRPLLPRGTRAERQLDHLHRLAPACRCWGVGEGGREPSHGRGGRLPRRNLSQDTSACFYPNSVPQQSVKTINKKRKGKEGCIVVLPRNTQGE